MSVSRGLMPPWLVRHDLLSPDECRDLLSWALDNEARFRPATLDKFVRGRQPGVVDAAGWKAIDAAEIARGGGQRPRDKFTATADMVAAAANGPAPSVRERLLAGLHR